MGTRWNSWSRFFKKRSGNSRPFSEKCIFLSDYLCYNKHRSSAAGAGSGFDDCGTAGFAPERPADLLGEMGEVMDRKVIRRGIWEYTVITVAALLMDVGIYVFKFPNNFSFGGVSVLR